MPLTASIVLPRSRPRSAERRALGHPALAADHACRAAASSVVSALALSASSLKAAASSPTMPSLRAVASREVEIAHRCCAERAEERLEVCLARLRPFRACARCRSTAHERPVGCRVCRGRHWAYSFGRGYSSPGRGYRSGLCPTPGWYTRHPGSLKRRRTVRHGPVQACSADSRSAQSSSASSSPTRSRSRPARDPVALPAVPRLHRRLRAAEEVAFVIRRVAVSTARASARRRTRSARRCRGSERSRPPGATRGARRGRRAVAVWRSTRTRSVFRPREQQPGDVGRADGARALAEAPEPLVVVGAARHDRADERVVVAGEVLGAAVEREVRACSSGRRWTGVAAVESQTTRAGCAAAASRSGIVRSGFAGASSQTSWTPSGGGPVWSNSTWRRPQRSSSLEHHARAEVGALGERDRVAGLQQREHERGRGGGCRSEEKRLPFRRAFELRDRALGLDPGRVGVARVDESAGLAVLVVRPDRGAVDAQEASLTVTRARLVRVPTHPLLEVHA